jgi:TRAP-type mannitol/chloroaromatic compound transport system permease large subunit
MLTAKPDLGRLVTMRLTAMVFILIGSRVFSWSQA